MTNGLTSRAATFLDRDGVLNVAPVVDGVPRPASPGDVQLLDGVEDACAALVRAGLVLVVVTNQPDVARGTTTRAEVDEIHHWLAARLPITEFRVCTHDDGDGCDCRKPAPGLLQHAAADLDLDLARSVMVGDRWRDVEAGRAAGVRTVFVDHGYAEALPHPADVTVPDLATAVPFIIEHARGG
ncbi:MAG TPA: HAD-IIIA family hydrolase [Acidimicrobiia bacterium]|nr:HAD-IIIA family hydrolase [Acidimicrobiia bacterium]